MKYTRLNKEASNKRMCPKSVSHVLGSTLKSEGCACREAITVHGGVGSL